MQDASQNKNGRSVSDSTVRGFFVLTLSTLSSAIFRMLVVAVMARLLNAQDFGIVAISNVFIEFARIITMTGISQSLVQKRDLSEEDIKTGFSVSIFVGILAMFLTIIFAPFIASFFQLPDLKVVLYVSSSVPPLVAISTISSKLLERAHDFKPLATSNFISYLFAQVAVGVPVALAGGGYWALIIPQVVSNLLQSIMLLRAQPHSLSLFFGRKQYRELMKTGTGFGLQRFANFFAQRGDYFVVGKLLGPLALGLYERSYVLMNLSNSLLASMLSTVLFPAFARVAHDNVRFRRAYVSCMELAATVTIPISMVSVVMAQEIVGTLLGNRWLDASVPFGILAGGIFARTCYKISNSAGNGLGLANENAISQTIYAVCVVGGAFIGSFWGVNGVATSTLIAITIVFISLNGTVMRHIGMTWLDMFKAMQPGLLLGAVLSLTSYVVIAVLRHETALPAVVRFIVATGVDGLVFAACAILAAPTFLGKSAIDLIRERMPKGPAGRVLALIVR